MLVSRERVSAEVKASPIPLRLRCTRLAINESESMLSTLGQRSFRVRSGRALIPGQGLETGQYRESGQGLGREVYHTEHVDAWRQTF